MHILRRNSFSSLFFALATTTIPSYSRDTPTRFKKELIRAAQSDEGTIQIEELNQVLINIGKEEERLSEDEFDQLLKAAGEDAKKGRCITTSQMWQLV